VRRRYDLVVAAYVLGELGGPGERARAVAALWARTAGALVLLEPGTPAGSAAVRDARAQVSARLARGGGWPVPACRWHPHDRLGIGGRILYCARWRVGSW
jgi:hypothetical protein